MDYRLKKREEVYSKRGENITIEIAGRGDVQIWKIWEVDGENNDYDTDWGFKNVKDKEWYDSLDDIQQDSFDDTISSFA